jgi:recombination protein RecT
MSKHEDLATTVAAKGQALTKGGDSIFALIEKQKVQISKALAGIMDTDRFLRVIMTEVRRNPALEMCSPASFLGAMMVSAQLGLEPGPSGHCYFVPFGKECTLIIGYRGYILLAWRSSQIKIDAYEIFDNDEFDFDVATDKAHHRWDIKKDRGSFVGVWAKATFPNGMTSIRVMSLKEVEEHRAKSKAKDGTAWVEHYRPMCLKTVTRVMAAYLPLSAQVQRAFAADESSTTARFAGDHIELEGDIVLDGESEIIEVVAEQPKVYKTPMLGDD